MRENDILGSIGNNAFECKNGNLILLGQLRNDTVLLEREIILDPLKDFSISRSIKYDHGVTKKSFGMILFDRHYTHKPKILLFYFVS